MRHPIGQLQTLTGRLAADTFQGEETMKVTALVFAIIGALNTLTYATYTYAYGSFFYSFSDGGYGGAWKFWSIVIPIAAIIGAGSLWSAPKFAGWLLLGSAIFILLMIGFNFFSMVSIVLLGGAGIFSLIVASDENEKVGQPIYRKPPPLDPPTAR
jgi:hypothetical protein